MRHSPSWRAYYVSSSPAGVAARISLDCATPPAQDAATRFKRKHVDRRLRDRLQRALLELVACDNAPNRSPREVGSLCAGLS